MKLNEIPRPQGRKKKKTKRLGRGDASGQGGTAGRGHKGQKARAGGYHKVGFEGGQMPLRRRLPKRGFTNIFATRYGIINVEQLAVLEAGTVVTEELILERGMTGRLFDGIKVLGRGEIANPITLKVRAISATARSKIEAAGGTVEVIRG